MNIEQLNVVILAGGFGKRIKEVWDEAKGLIPLWGKTILWFVLSELEEMKAPKILMVSNAAHYKKYCEYCLKEGFEKVKIVSDAAETAQEARGALRDLKIGLEQCGEGDVLVLPCDTVTKGVFTLEDMVRFGQMHVDGVTVVAREMEETKIVGRYGNVRINEEGRIVEFIEKPKVAISPYAAAAIYYYPAATRAWVQEYLEQGGNPESPGMIIPWLIGQGRAVYGYKTPGGIVDVGSKLEYLWTKDARPA